MRKQLLEAQARITQLESLIGIHHNQIKALIDLADTHQQIIKSITARSEAFGLEKKDV